MQHREGKIVGTGDAQVYFQEWMPENPPRAMIFVIHGAAEHSGRYARFAAHFVRRGYAVTAIDHIGHGKSSGTPGFIERFDHYVDTVSRFAGLLQRNHPELPLILLGHSMGGLISTCYLLDHPGGISGCILSGPAIMTELEPPWWQRTMIRLFSLLAPRMGALQLDASGVSRDPYEVRKYIEDPLVYNGKLSARKVAELFKAMGMVQERAAEISVPLLLLHGGDDKMTAPAGSRFLHDHVSSTDKTLKIYPELYHEIFNEPERAQVFADIEAWLDARFGAGQATTDDSPAAAPAEQA